MNTNTDVRRWYRPRVAALVILLMIAAPMVLANLCCDGASDVDEESLHLRYPYGWPLTWYWRTIQWDLNRPWIAPTPAVRYGVARLALNLLVWSAALAMVALVCEKFFRRFPPPYRWSLKAMLSGTALLAVPCAWFAALHHRASVQDPIIAEVEGNAGGVELERWGPRWLDLVGADPFRRRIVGVQLAGPENEISQDLLERLSSLPSLSWLDIDNVPLAPGAAAALAGLKQLRVLYLNGTSISNDDLPAVAELSGLKVLHLGGSRINDERAPNNDDGIAHLAGLANLEELYLGATEVLGHGLKQLATLEKLRLLDLSYCPLTDSALEELPRLAQLETLYLQGTGVDDYELPRLAELPRLKVLDVAVTRVTAEGLAALGLLESLRELGIGKSSVSPTGLESLRASKQLRSLHITGANQWNPGMVSLALDGGDEFNVDEAEELDFRRALESLRSQRRRVWIDSQVVPNPRGRERPGQRLVERPPPADRKRGPPWVGGVF